MPWCCAVRMPTPASSRIDTAAVRALPGVVAVLTAQDLAGAVGDIPPRHTPELEGKNVPEHPVLARDKVCYVGQPVAIVVAHDRYQARDALDLFQVTYQPLPPLVDAVAAAQDSAPLLHQDFGTNVMMRLRWDAAMCRRPSPRPSRCARALRGASAGSGPHGRPWAGGALRAGNAMLDAVDFDAGAAQGKRYVSQILHQPPRELRVIAPDVGGGFGQKVEIWPEEVACSYLAMRLGQPLKWIEERWENMLAYHGRGYSAEVEAAVRRDGTILGMRFRIVADVGAYFMNATAGPPVNAAQRVAGPYAIPAMDVECLSVLTNKPSTGPYRGAGGPEGPTSWSAPSTALLASSAWTRSRCDAVTLLPLMPFPIPRPPG